MGRERRGAGENTPSHQVTSSRNVPNYRLFLKGSANTVVLAKYACESIGDKAPGCLQQNNDTVLAREFSSGQTIKNFTNSGMGMVPHVFSNNEAADTWVVLHAADQSSSQSRVVLCSDDTDVLVILLCYNRGPPDKILMTSTCTLVTLARSSPDIIIPVLTMGDSQPVFSAYSLRGSTIDAVQPASRVKR